jgi:uncharacterized membrane protein YadS
MRNEKKSTSKAKPQRRKGGIEKPFVNFFPLFAFLFLALAVLDDLGALMVQKIFAFKRNAA